MKQLRQLAIQPFGDRFVFFLIATGMATVLAAASARTMVELLPLHTADPGAQVAEPADLHALELGFRWIVTILAAVIAAGVFVPGTVVGAITAGTVLLALLFLRNIPAEVLNLTATGNALWPPKDLEPFFATLSMQVLVGTIVVAVLVQLMRGDWPTFGATGFATVGIAAAILAAASALNAKPASPASTTQVIVEGTYYGRAPASSDPVTVVFVVPKRTDTGAITAHESKTHKAKVFGATQCSAGHSCGMTVTIERGTDDVSLASWATDAASALTVSIFGPGPDLPSPSPVTSPASSSDP